MDGTEWKNTSGDESSVTSTSGSVQSSKSKRRSLVERELETSLTSKVVLPSSASDGGNTSRYGRSRKAKTDSEFCDTDEVVKLLKPYDSPVKPIVYKMYASNSPVRQDVEKPIDAEKSLNETETIKKDMSGNTNDELKIVSPNKVYVRRDLIQKKDESLIKNMLSSSKRQKNSHINNILERSSEKYNLDTETTTNGFIDNTSVVKTLDFDTGKKKRTEERKSLPSKSEQFEIEANCAYQVGDLAWARVGTYPFWPCIVTREPFSELFVKKKLCGRTEREIIHVTFFADNGRRGWVLDGMLRRYVGLQEFEDTRDQFTAEVKKKDPRLYAAYFISDKKKDIWNLSVEEAETFLREPKRLRIDMLKEMLSKNKNVKVIKKPKSNRIARTDSDVSLSESLYDSLFSEDDTKIEDADHRPRHKSLDVSEVVTACLDNMAAKTGISMIQKQSHMDRWLQKAKSKTPEKPPTITPVKRQSLSLKKKTPAKETLRKSKECHNISLKAHKKDDYKKFDIENENPLSNCINVVTENQVDHRELLNDVRVDNEAQSTEFNGELETSAVDDIIVYKAKEGTGKESLKENVNGINEDVNRQPDEERVSEINKSDTNCEGQADVSMEDINSEKTKELKDEVVSETVVKELNSSIVIDVSEDLSEEFGPDVSFEESKRAQMSVDISKCKTKVDCLDMTDSKEHSNVDVEETSEDNKAADKSNQNEVEKEKCKETKDTHPNSLNDSSSKMVTSSLVIEALDQSEPKGLIIKTPNMLNQSIINEDLSTTDIALDGSTPIKARVPKSNSKRRSNDSFRLRSLVQRDNRPKRKCAKQAYTIGGTDDPDFLIYLETHQDSIMDENPDLSHDDLVNYLHKTWTYERDIKTSLLMDDDDIDVEETRKEQVEVASKPALLVDGPVIIIEDDEITPKQSKLIEKELIGSHERAKLKQKHTEPDGETKSMVRQHNNDNLDNKNNGKYKIKDMETTEMATKTSVMKSQQLELLVSLQKENLQEKLITLRNKESKIEDTSKIIKQIQIQNTKPLLENNAESIITQERKDDFKVILLREDLEEKMNEVSKRDAEKKLITEESDAIVDKSDISKESLQIENLENKNERSTNDTQEAHKSEKNPIHCNKESEKNINEENNFSVSVKVAQEENKEQVIQIKSPDMAQGETKMQSPESSCKSNTNENVREKCSHNVVIKETINDTAAQIKQKDMTVLSLNKSDAIVKTPFPMKVKDQKPVPENHLRRTPESKTSPTAFAQIKMPIACVKEVAQSNKLNKSPSALPRTPKIRLRSPTTRQSPKIINLKQSKESPKSKKLLSPRCDIKNVNQTNITFKTNPSNKTAIIKSPEEAISTKIYPNEKDIPVPKKVLVRSLSKPLPKEPVINKGFVDLTEDDEDDDDIPSPEFEIHTVDSKEKEFITELRKSILPELMKDIDSKIKKETCELELTNTENPKEVVDSNKTPAKSDDNVSNNIIVSQQNGKPGNGSEDMSIDGLTEDALLQSSDEENADCSRLEVFEDIVKERANNMDIRRAEDTDVSKANENKTSNAAHNKVESLNGEVDKLKTAHEVIVVDQIITPKVNQNKSHLSLKKITNQTLHNAALNPNLINNLDDQKLLLNDKATDKPLQNGYLSGQEETNKHAITKNKDNAPMANGYLNNSKSHKEDVVTDGIDHDDEKDEIKRDCRSKRKVRYKSDASKKAYNAFDDPEFMLYVESRQDSVMDENPELSEEDVVKYLHKTWMYEHELKSDRQIDDEIEQSNLVKGLVTQVAKPRKFKRQSSEKSLPVVRIERMNLRNKVVAEINKIGSSEENNDDCEIVTNGDLIETISIVSEKDSSTSEYTPSDDEVEMSSPSIEEDISLARVKADISKETKYKLTDKSKSNVTEDNLNKSSKDNSSKTNKQCPTNKATAVKKESDLITPEDLNINDKKHIISNTVPSSPFSSPVKSDASEDSRPRRQQRAKTDRNPNFPSVREVNSALDDPDFLKYLELRQDALTDENPHLSQDDIVKYLYKTWVYEQNLKTETEINDEFENSNLVKGLNDKPAQPKKVRKKIKEAKTEKDFKIEIDLELPSKDKPKRNATKQFYFEDETDIEDELEVFEIFKTKVKKPKTEDSDTKTETHEKDKACKPENDEDIPLNPENLESEEELDDIEEYFLKLTQPKPNIFKGFTRERVCEICFKTGKLVKCKGPCSGTFHVDCVKNEKAAKEEEVTQSTRGRKKKYKRTCPWLRNDKREAEDNPEEKEISDEPVLVIDAGDFEEKLAAKMKEILNQDEVIELDSSSDEEITWKETRPGKCEIVDVKLKIKKPPENYDDFKCNHCQTNQTPLCFVCKSTKSPKNNVELRQKCQSAHCLKFYHVECLDQWPQTQISDSVDRSFTCPLHVCHTCVSDDPRGCKTRFSGDKLARCVKCPATYHSFTKCLPAGSKILSASHILCPRHCENPPGKVPCHVNTGWCFICAAGGTLICCEYCPTSFHTECLQIKPPEGNYMCEDCETGRLPLYGEMVWVKLGHYRWWPGIVLHPTEIPDNINAMKHSHGEFVVRFFGQYDHYWVNRGRVFPFQEGDTGRISSQKSKIDEAFTIAMEHAARAFEIIKNAPPNEEEDTDIQSSLLPPHYVKLRVNKPVGSLINKKIEDLNSLTQCECDPRDTDPCGMDSQCLNRMLLTECGPTCLAGDRCHNRMFERREYPRLAPRRAPHRGWGLYALENINAGQFVIEYVGELVDEMEFNRRMRSMHAARDENYYFLTLDKDRVIDAGPKGNLARFMNHSCEPNCETQKWTVLGDVRVGLFALRDIPANSELTFNYNLECTGIEKKQCMCGAKRCSGYIGAKPKTLEETQPKKIKPLQKRTYKKRKVEESPPTVKKLGRPRKQKELTEIEKDLLIIKSATISGSSDSENSTRLNSAETDEKKALKRKRFSTDETVSYNSDSSPCVKKVKTESDSVSERSDLVT